MSLKTSLASASVRMLYGIAVILISNFAVAANQRSRRGVGFRLPIAAWNHRRRVRSTLRAAAVRRLHLRRPMRGLCANGRSCSVI